MKYTGRDYIIDYAIADENANPAGLTFKRLGMLRTKSLGMTWDTVDTTGDTNDDYTRSNLVTFKSFTLSGDAVFDDAAGENQTEFMDHVTFPPSSTQYQPKVWLKITRQDGVVRQGPFLVTSCNESANYDAEMTWDFEAMSNGALTKV